MIMCVLFIILGGFGVDFSVYIDDYTAGLSKVAKRLLEHGITSFCPTVVTSKPDVYKKVNIPLLSSVLDVLSLWHYIEDIFFLSLY